MTQPVQIQGFQDEFELPKGHQLEALAVLGSIIKCSNLCQSNRQDTIQGKKTFIFYAIDTTRNV